MDILTKIALPQGMRGLHRAYAQIQMRVLESSCLSVGTSDTIGKLVSLLFKILVLT